MTKMVEMTHQTILITNISFGTSVNIYYMFDAFKQMRHGLKKHG